jgi:hypothetical protein
MNPRDSKLLRDQAYIGGEWVEASDSRRFDVTDPANGSVIASVANCTSRDAETAITAAQAALAGWRHMPGKERSRLLRRWFDLMTLHTDELGKLLAREQGKPLAEAKGEIVYGASFVEWFAEEARRAYGDVIPAPDLRPRNPRFETANRGYGGDYAVEFSQRDDYPQDRPGACRRLHLGRQAGGGNPAVGTGARRSRAGGGYSRRRAQYSALDAGG